MKKKVLIIGPIVNSGGLTVEVNIIAKALEHKYIVSLLSTKSMSENSFALKKLEFTNWKSIPKIIFDNFFLIRFFTKLSRFWNRGDLEIYHYVINSISKKILKIYTKHDEVLYSEIEKADIVLVCGTLSYNFLPKIVNDCFGKNKSCIIRVTGTIKDVPEIMINCLDKITSFICHSRENSMNLKKHGVHLPVKIIDQCSQIEDDLLSLPILTKRPYKYGYIGRLSKEKEILSLTDFFASSEYPFFIAGDGEQREGLQEIIKNSRNCTYIGMLKHEEIPSFFENIDVLVISSNEEAGPLVGVEAMAAGKLIISTKVGAMVDRLNNINSYWFNINDELSLKDNIDRIEMISLNEFHLQGLSYRKQYLKNNSMKLIKSQYCEIIDYNV